MHLEACEGGRVRYACVTPFTTAVKAASPLLMTSPTVGVLRSPGFWESLVERYAARFAARPSKVKTYRELLASGAMEEASAAYADGRLVLAPPRRLLINRSGGRRKTVYLFPPREDLFLKGVNHALQLMPALHSPLCHSFQRGRGVRSAYAAIRQVADLDHLSCLHVDVRDYFASIPVGRLLESLPLRLAQDEALLKLLQEMLSDDSRGVLAGTPLAPLLSNLYLRPLDDLFESSHVPYLRYADDLILFDKAESILSHHDAIAKLLLELGLEINARKLRLSSPGAAWEFLGLRNDHGLVDLATTTLSKMHHRVRRLSRRAQGRRDPARYVIRRLNRKLFGIGADTSAFTWATWFFPLINSDVGLRRLDHVVQEQLRFAVTRRHERRNRGAMPYAQLAARGYLPLVTAFRAYRRGPGDYEWVLDRRVGG